MVSDHVTNLTMDASNLREDVLLTNRALWLKQEQFAHMQKAKLKRRLYMYFLLFFSPFVACKINTPVVYMRMKVH